MANVRWSLRRTPTGYDGLVTIPSGAIPLPSGAVRPAGPIAVKARGGSPAQAIAQAADLADKLVGNPVIAAVMPPGTRAAVQATKLIAKHGPAALKKLTGPGAQRLANVLFPGSGTAVKAASKLFRKIF